MEQSATDSTSPTAVRVGSYSLELSATTETFLLFESRPEEANAGNLVKALGSAAPDANVSTTAPVLDEVVEDASVVTARCEKAVRLFNDLAAGKAADPKVVSEEIDALLGLLGRLDRSGRHKEALRLARDLAALLALFLRWVELVRTLELAVRTARAIGDREAEAWALHELGSLHLAAGDALESSRLLSEALRIREKLGARGRCATRHNLDAARRDLAGLDRSTPPVKRRGWLRPVGGGALVALLAAAGLTLGLTTTSASHTTPTTAARPTQSLSTGSTDTRPGTRTDTDTTTRTDTSATTGTSSTTDTSTDTGSTTTTTTTTTTGPLDSTPPRVALDAPAADSFLAATVPTFSGSAGLAPGDLRTITVRVFRGPTTGGEQVERLTTQRDDSGNFKVAASPALTEGVYTARVEQLDQVGNVGSAATTFTVDLSAPVVTVTSPKARTETTEKPTISGVAGTLPGDLAAVEVTVSKYKAPPSTPPVETLKTTADASGSWSVDSGGLQPGEWYTATVTQTDEAGNTGSDQVVFSVAIPPPILK